MSLDSNRKDFEESLEEMKVVIGDMEPCVDDSLLDTLKRVIREYEYNYSDDINELMDERDNLQYKIDEAGI